MNRRRIELDTAARTPLSIAPSDFLRDQVLEAGHSKGATSFTSSR